MPLHRLSTLAFALALTGCVVGPDYARPGVDVPAKWRIDYQQAADVADTRWWEQFGDPVLNGLIDEALRANRDVRIAAARVDQFKGALQSTRSQLFPTIGYSADASRTQASRVGQPPLPAGADPVFTLYNAALGASWQADLFGRVRRLSEAAQAQVYAGEQAQRGVVLSVVTGVAASYITLRALDRQLEVAQAATRNFGESVRVFELRFRAGIVSQSEVSQVRSQYQQAQATIPELQRAITQVENLLSLLLARNPGPIARGKPLDALGLPAVPADLPATLLERRPDILQAEQNMVAANANVGAARALYYPDLTLTGALGSTTTALGYFLNGPAAVWQLAAGVSGPIFTFGAIEGQVRSEEARSRQAVLAYQQTIANAFRETDDALSGAFNKRQQATAADARVASLREFARLSNLRFERGLVGYLEVLVAENELFAAELAAVTIRGEQRTQLVAVYGAMGGGWVDRAEAIALPGRVAAR